MKEDDYLKWWHEHLEMFEIEKLMEATNIELPIDYVKIVMMYKHQEHFNVLGLDIESFERIYINKEV